MAEMVFLSFCKGGKDLNLSSANNIKRQQLPLRRWITTQWKVSTAVLPQSLFSLKMEIQKLWPTEQTVSLLKFLPLVLAFGVCYHSSITPGKDSDSTVSKDILHRAYNPESGTQLLFKIATLPLKSFATELMTRLLRVLPQLCLRLLISKQVINSLVTSGFSGIIASDVFNSPLFL